MTVREFISKLEEFDDVDRELFFWSNYEDANFKIVKNFSLIHDYYQKGWFNSPPRAAKNTLFIELE